MESVDAVCHNINKYKQINISDCAYRARLYGYLISGKRTPSSRVTSSSPYWTWRQGFLLPASRRSFPAAPLRSTTPHLVGPVATWAETKTHNLFVRESPRSRLALPCLSRHAGHSGDPSQHSSGSSWLGVADHQHRHNGSGGTDPAESSGSTGESQACDYRKLVINDNNSHYSVNVSTKKRDRITSFSISFQPKNIFTLRKLLRQTTKVAS